MEMLNYWIIEIALWFSGVLYAHAMERREPFYKRVVFYTVVFCIYDGIVNVLSLKSIMELMICARFVGWGLLILFLHGCWKLYWSSAVYYSIWAFLNWHLVYEVWLGMRLQGWKIYSLGEELDWIGIICVYAVGYLITAFTIVKWMREEAPKKVGPKQLWSALLIFFTFEMIGYTPGNVEMNPGDGKWEVLYLSQLLLGVILYLQSELFKKSAMRQELEVMNLLWKKEQEQYQLSRENIALINQKCHDLKHQIRAVRTASREEIEQYLLEMEDEIQIYEAIVKTGNEVLDTILTEKSLYCKERGIVVSCVADGSQMEFINTVDLYAILGNAIDNAIEAVEKFEHKEKRQIDVLIYRQQNFLVMNIINPLKENLVFEEELPVSTKGDRRFHGFGLRSIRYLVKKYDGFLSISEEDGCFSLKMLIPIPAK